MLRLLAGFVLAVSAEAAQRAQIPAAIAAPEATPVVTLHAEGAQLYECKAGGRRQARLGLPRADRVADRSTARPSGVIMPARPGNTWAAAPSPANLPRSSPGATANDIPWLKLEVASRRGKGMLADIDIIQRINTSGGALRGACEPAGALRAVPYSADYVFLRKGS